MKVPMPKLKPKQKLIMLVMVATIGLVIYLMSNAFSSKQKVESKGAVVVKQGSSSTREVSSKVTQNNQANKELEELKEKEIEKATSEETDDSYVTPIELKASVTDLDGDDDGDVTSRRENVLDIGDIVKELEQENEEKQKPKEKEKVTIVEKASKKEKLEKTIKTIDFDKKSYLASLRNTVSSYSVNPDAFFEKDIPVAATISTYDTGTSKEESTNKYNQNDYSDTTDYGDEAKSMRDRALANYVKNRNSLRQSLTGESDDTSGSAGSSDDFNEPNYDEESDYPYREVKSVGDMIYAVNNLNINSDHNNVVQFTIVAPGDSHGAVVSGNFTKFRDTLALRFNMYSKNGKSYPINAMAIDPDTYATVFADDVDKHYFQRYGGIIIASMIEGYADSLVNTTVTNTDSGSNENTERVEKFSDRLMVGVGKAGERLAPMFEKDFNRESTVYVYKDKPVGLLFLDNFKVPISE